MIRCTHPESFCPWVEEKKAPWGPSSLEGIEVPVPMELLTPAPSVAITFPDDGGKVASAILRVSRKEQQNADEKAIHNQIRHRWFERRTSNENLAPICSTGSSMRAT